MVLNVIESVLNTLITEIVVKCICTELVVSDKLGIMSAADVIPRATTMKGKEERTKIIKPALTDCL